MLAIFISSGLVPAASTAQAAPVVSQSTLGGEPIWANGSAASGSVALFRQRFTLANNATELQLAIFADTRYEAYLDGQLVGRGPARFARVRQEFDTLPVPPLGPGTHVLAVLVQHAPDVRRSEGIRAGLQAELQGRVGNQTVVLAATSSRWRAVVSPAWNSKARWISNLGLIGPQELLDLRQLPADWTRPGFDDAAWLPALPLAPTPYTNLLPRSIPLLANTPRAPLRVVEAGLLSPGMQLLDFEAGNGAQREVVLRAGSNALLRLEATLTTTVLLNNRTLVGWQTLRDPRRPDVFVVEQRLAPGIHRLLIEVPPVGRALAVGGNNVSVEQPPPLSQGQNPERRTLLANHVPGNGPTTTLRPSGSDIVVPDGLYGRYVALDLGRVMHGRIAADVSGPAGTLVEIGWDERLLQNRPMPAPGSLHKNLWRQIDSWVLDGTGRALTTIDTRAGRYLLLTIFGPGPVQLRNLRVVEEHYPVEQVGSFRSSDARLDQIWQVGADTTALNMLDAYADPWRERGQWWGDVMASYRVNAVAFGDTALLKRGLLQMADAWGPDGRPPAFAPAHNDRTLLLDYGMLWVEGLRDYWRVTGDAALVRELFPTVRGLATFLQSYEDTSGLLTFAPEARWYESALIDWAAGPARRGTGTALNAQYAATLGMIAELATVLGDSAEAQAYQAKQARVTTVLNQRLSDPSGGYITALVPDAAQPPRPQAQAWPLAYDVVPPERRAATADVLEQQLTPFLLDRGPVVEIYGMHWVFEALASTGRIAAAQQLIRAQYGRLLDRGATTWWEGFRSDEAYDASLSHGWGGGPTPFLSRYVLGAQTTGPRTWLVAPQPGELLWAEGALPTPQGTLQVAWNRPTCGVFELRVTAPANSSGALLLPLPTRASQAALDGRLIWDGGPLPDSPATFTPNGLRLDGLTGTVRASYRAPCANTFLPLLAR